MQTTRQCGTRTFVRCQKKRLACCVLDGTCTDLPSFVAVVVRSLVVLDENVPDFNWQPRQRRHMVSMTLHPSPVLICKVSSMHSCHSTLLRQLCIASPCDHASNNQQVQLLIETSILATCIECSMHSHSCMYQEPTIGLLCEQPYQFAGLV